MTTRLFISVLLLCGYCSAQQSLASLRGDVLDPSGAGIPNAEVMARSLSTKREFQTKSSESGAYTLDLIPAGAYEVSFFATNFKRQVFSRIVLEVNQIARLDARLQLGETVESIVVTDPPALLQASESSLGTAVHQNQIRELPLNGRRFLDLALLVPGATASPGGSRQETLRGTLSSAFNVNGNREASNVFLMDGTLNHDSNYNTFVISPIVESIEEFRVQTNNYSAEFGQQAGAQINLITRSGTNEIHGTLSHYLRNSALDAKNLFDRPAPAKIPPFRQNQFGGTAGGPVLRNKTFFFATYEGFRQVRAQTSTAVVPNAQIREGDFTAYRTGAGDLVQLYDPATTRLNPAFDPQTSPSTQRYLRDPFPANRIPTNRLSPIATGILKYVDTPNLEALSLGTGRYLNNAPQQQTIDQGSGRIDHTLSRAEQLFLRYSRSNEFALVPSALSSQQVRREPLGHVATLAYTRIFSPRLTNDFRMGFTRYLLNIVNRYAFSENILAKLGVKGVDSLPPSVWDIPNIDFSTAGIASIGPVTSPVVQRNNTYHINESLSYNRGRSELRAGVVVQRIQLNEAAEIETNPTYSYRATPYTASLVTPTGVGAGSIVADFLLGISHQNNISVGNAQVYLRRTYVAPWINYSWRATSDLTVNLGFRWEYVPPMVEKYDRIATIAVAGFNGPPPVIPIQAGKTIEGYGSVPRGVVDTEYGNFAPRIGLAYRLGHSGRSVVRAGYGIFYDAEIGNTTVDLVRNFPFRQRVAAFAPDSINPALTIEQPLSPGAVAGIAYLAAGQNEGGRMKFPIGSVQQWNVSIQRQLLPSLVVEAAYVGSTGRHLSYAQRFNLPRPGPGALDPKRPFYPNFTSAFQFVVPRANSYYNALQMKAETREWRGLTLLSSYTWSKSIDTAQQSRGAGGGSTVFAMNIFDIDLESRGRSNFDVSQLWVNSAIFRLPEPRWAAGKPKSPGGLLLSGWQLNSILTARTGFPITVYSGVDTANVGNGNDTHASTVPGQALISPGATADNWLNRAAFTFGPDCRLASVFATLSSPSQCYGTAGRNIVNAPGLFNLDFSLVKNIAVTDRAGIQFRAEAFNITNTPALGFPANRISNPAFGRILSAGPSRQIQFALRLHF